MLMDFGTTSTTFRLPMERQRRDYLNRHVRPYYGYDGTTSDSVTTSIAVSSATKSIFVGVCTGVSVWVITKMLDKMFGLSLKD